MKKEQTKALYQAITEINDDLIEEAQTDRLCDVRIVTGKRRFNWAGLGAVACALIAIGGGLWMYSRMYASPPVHPPESSVSGTNITSTTASTTTADSQLTEEQEIHGICSQLAEVFYRKATGYAYEDTTINMHDHVENDRFAAWLHYRLSQEKWFSEIKTYDYTYTPVAIREDGDYRFVTATVSVDVTKDGGEGHNLSRGLQRFVLQQQDDGSFTVLDWYDETEGSRDKEYRGAYDDEIFKSFWITSSRYNRLSKLLGWAPSYSYPLPKLAGEAGELTFRNPYGTNYTCNEQEAERLMSAVSMLQCSLMTTEDTSVEGGVHWKISQKKHSSDEGWIIFIYSDDTLTFVNGDERVYLKDYSGAVQELTSRMMLMTMSAEVESSAVTETS